MNSENFDVCEEHNVQTKFYEKFHYNVEADRCSDIFEILLNHFPLSPNKYRFLELGGSDGRLKHLLGIKCARYDKTRYAMNRKLFTSLFEYTGTDLRPRAANIIGGDVCKKNFLKNYPSFYNYFDVIYSNNVFEHLPRPWVTIRHIDSMLKVNGLCAIVAPFASRYHKCPGDFFRYTHTAIPSMFMTETHSHYEILLSGYDISQRRENVLGRGTNALPEDDFGGWRETWYTVCVVKKISQDDGNGS